MKSKRRTTLRDVAREAGVSYQTVSRVINDNDNVAPATRERVLLAIDKLDYRPNRAAQVMQTERSQTIEVIMPYYGFNRVLADMARITHQSGYHFSISAIDNTEFAEALISASSRFIDGLILTPLSPIIDDYDELKRLTKGIPFVQIGARLGTNLPSVIYDHAQGARLATQHLINLGHKVIAEISGPLWNYDGYDRHEGWLATLADNNLDPSLSVEGDFTVDGGYQAMQQLLDMNIKFSAAFVANDMMAFGAQTALRERGLRIPEDVSIVGFDDLQESAHFVPSLTTVRQDFALLGRLAIEYVVSLIENPDTPIYQRVLPPQLVVRKSTQPYR